MFGDRLIFGIATKTGNFLPSYLEAIVNSIPPGSIIVTFAKDSKIIEFAKAKNIHVVVIHPWSQSYDYKLAVEFCSMFIMVGGIGGETKKQIRALARKLRVDVSFVYEREDLHKVIDKLNALGGKEVHVPPYAKGKWKE